jgi:magnesium and cobalt transporter
VLQKDGSILIESDIKIRDVNRLLTISLPEEDNPTLGALISKEMGRIPEEGEELTIDRYRIKICTVEDRSIGRVRIKKEETGISENED